MDVEYVYQELDVLPKGYEVPEGRVKPWGTGHAILCAAEAIDGAPFAVINSDDYYGRTAFEEIYRQLTTEQDGATYQYAMVAYDLYKTLTDNGHVAAASAPQTTRTTLSAFMSAQESRTTADRPNTPRMTAQPGPDCRREPSFP